MSKDLLPHPQKWGLEYVVRFLSVSVPAAAVEIWYRTYFVGGAFLHMPRGCSIDPQDNSNNDLQQMAILEVN